MTKQKKSTKSPNYKNVPEIDNVMACRISWQARVIKLVFRKTLKKLFMSGLPAEQIRAEIEKPSLFTRVLSFAQKFAPKNKTNDTGYNIIDFHGVPSLWCGSKTAPITILYLHGGGYFFGSPALYQDLVTGICKASNARGLIPDYRLAPENPFPAAVDDAMRCYDGLLADGHNPANIIIAGDSAGGGLSAALLMRVRDEGKPMPRAGVLISPWTDLSGSGDSVVANAEKEDVLYGALIAKSAAYYYADTAVEHPYVSPLFGSFEKFPPLLVQVGTHEILLDDATRLVSKARETGIDVIYQPFYSMPHVFHFAHAFVPEAKQAIANIGEFITTQIATP